MSENTCVYDINAFYDCDYFCFGCNSFTLKYVCFCVNYNDT